MDVKFLGKKDSRTHLTPFANANPLYLCPYLDIKGTYLPPCQFHQSTNLLHPQSKLQEIHGVITELWKTHACLSCQAPTNGLQVHGLPAHLCHEIAFLTLTFLEVWINSLQLCLHTPCSPRECTFDANYKPQHELPCFSFTKFSETSEIPPCDAEGDLGGQFRGGNEGLHHGKLACDLK